MSDPLSPLVQVGENGPWVRLTDVRNVTVVADTKTPPPDNHWVVVKRAPELGDVVVEVNMAFRPAFRLRDAVAVRLNVALVEWAEMQRTGAVDFPAGCDTEALRWLRLKPREKNPAADTYEDVTGRVVRVCQSLAAAEAKPPWWDQDVTTAWVIALTPACRGRLKAGGVATVGDLAKRVAGSRLREIKGVGWDYESKIMHAFDWAIADKRIQPPETMRP